MKALDKTRNKFAHKDKPYRKYDMHILDGFEHYAKDDPEDAVYGKKIAKQVREMLTQGKEIR